MAKGCTYTYKGVEYDGYFNLKEALIKEQSNFYFAPFLAAIENKLGTTSKSHDELLEISNSISEEYMLGKDISITLSELLSAATDNAKELILAKINAGPETAGVYAYLTMLGIPFTEIGAMMTSPEVKWVIDHSRKNVFDSKTDFNNLDRAVKELQEGPNIFKYLDLDRMSILSNIISENLNNPTFIETLSGDSKFRDPEIIKQLLNTDKKKGPSFKLNTLGGLTIPTDWNGTPVDLKIPVKDIRELYESLLVGFTNSKGEKIDFIPTKHSIISHASSMDEELDDSAYEEAYQGSAMIPVKVELSRYLKEVIDHIDSAPGSAGIQEFAKILEDSKETVTLGSMLSANQGIKTNPYNQYSFIRRVSDYVIKKSRDHVATEYEKDTVTAINDLSNQLAAKGLDNKFVNEVIENFDFLKFLGVGISTQDKKLYQETGKIWYNRIKSAFNIMAVVTETPHFNAMLNVAGLMENIKGHLSVKYNLVNKLIDDVYKNKIVESDGFNKTLSEKDFYKVLDFANDVIILKWLTSLNDSDRIFKHDSTSHYEAHDNVITKVDTDSEGKPLPVTTHTIDIKGAEGRLAFIDMIHEMMLVLKEGKTKIDGELKDHPLLKNNAFISAYDMDKKKDPITGKNNKFYKLPINVISAAESNSYKFNQYLIGFSDLGQVTYNGTPVKDLLFLYNTFIHRDKINRDSLTKLFESSVGGIEGSLMGQFIKWGGQLDWNNEAMKSLEEDKNYDYTVDDIIIKGLATKIFSRNLKKFKGKYAYSMIYDPNSGTMSKQYYVWSGDINNTTEGTYVPYTHFSKDTAIALSANSSIGIQLANTNDYNKVLTEIDRRGIDLNNLQINCE